MIHIDNLFQLRKQQPTNESVYVRSVKKIFRNHDGEWIERAYYSTEEVSQILGISYRRVLMISKKLGLRPPTIQRSHTRDQLIVIAQANKLQRENKGIKYTDIKKKLKLW